MKDKINLYEITLSYKGKLQHNWGTYYLIIKNTEVKKIDFDKNHPHNDKQLNIYIKNDKGIDYAIGEIEYDRESHSIFFDKLEGDPTWPFSIAFLNHLNPFKFTLNKNTSFLDVILFEQIKIKFKKVEYNND